MSKKFNNDGLNIQNYTLNKSRKGKHPLKWDDVGFTPVPSPQPEPSKQQEQQEGNDSN